MHSKAVVAQYLGGRDMTIGRPDRLTGRGLGASVKLDTRVGGSLGEVPAHSGRWQVDGP